MRGVGDTGSTPLGLSCLLALFFHNCFRLGFQTSAEFSTSILEEIAASLLLAERGTESQTYSLQCNLGCCAFPCWVELLFFSSYITICLLSLVLTVSQQVFPQTFSHTTDSSASLGNPIQKSHFSPDPLGRFSKPFIDCCLIFLHKQKTKLFLFVFNFDSTGENENGFDPS